MNASTDDPFRDPWWQKLLDLALPPRCVGCGLRGAEVCATCAARVRRLGPAVCPRCSIPSPGGRVCRRCATGTRPVQAILAAYPLEGTLRAAVLALKYRGRTRLIPFLTMALDAALADRPLAVDLVVPVPLSERRLNERGFNQAELLARPLAARHGWTVAHDALVRERDTEQQTRLPAAERRRNVVDAFRVVRPDLVAGGRILLVDDVCTTGATLEACATAVVKAGAAGAWAVVVAREVLQRRPSAL